MTYVVTETCIKCKYTDCVDVCPVDCFREGPNMLVIDPDECIDCTLCVAECPVDCFREGPNMLVIDPDECIDCAVCIPECPVNAILPEEDVPSDQLQFIKLNAELAPKWPSITKRKAPPADADEWKDRRDKLDQLVR